MKIDRDGKFKRYDHHGWRKGFLPYRRDGTYSRNKVLAFGKPLSSGREMKFFKRGVAVQVQKVSTEKAKKPSMQ